MSSLIHTKNVSNPGFKINDSILAKNEAPSHFLTHTEYESKPRRDPQAKLRAALRSNNISPLNPVILGDDRDYVSDLDSKSFTKHSAKNAYENQYKQQNQTLNLTVDKSIISPILASHNLAAQLTPTLLNNTSHEISNIHAPSMRHNLSGSFSGTIKTPARFISDPTDNEFREYLDFLGAGNQCITRKKFEDRLKGKAKKPNLSPGLTETDSPKLYRLPSYFNPTTSKTLKTMKTLETLGSIPNFGRGETLPAFHKRPKLPSIMGSPTGENLQNSVVFSTDTKSPAATFSPTKKTTMLLHSKTNIFDKAPVRAAPRTADQDNVFHELASNLQDLFKTVEGDEEKMLQAIEKLANQNTKVMHLSLPKFHKVNDYNAKKIEQKYDMIEIISEVLPIPVKLQKLKAGIVFIEPYLVYDLSALSRKIDEFNSQKRKEQLRYIEDKLVQSQIKLQEFKQKKLQDLRKGGNIKDFQAVQNAIDNLFNMNGNQGFDEDPMQAIEDYQRQHGEFKYVNKKNIEHAKGVNELFTRWRSQA